MLTKSAGTVAYHITYTHNVPVQQQLHEAWMQPEWRQCRTLAVVHHQPLDLCHPTAHQRQAVQWLSVIARNKYKHSNHTGQHALLTQSANARKTNRAKHRVPHAEKEYIITGIAAVISRVLIFF